jgi:hypothetical protein
MPFVNKTIQQVRFPTPHKVLFERSSPFPSASFNWNTRDNFTSQHGQVASEKETKRKIEGKSGKFVSPHKALSADNDN